MSRPRVDLAVPPESSCRILPPSVDLPPISPPTTPPGSRPLRRPWSGSPRSGRFEIATPETRARARRARRRRKTRPAYGGRWRATRAPPPSSRRANAAGASGASWRHSWRRRSTARKTRRCLTSPLESWWCAHCPLPLLSALKYAYGFMRARAACGVVYSILNVLAY